jgi:hypothetical protein
LNFQNQYLTSRFTSRTACSEAAAPLAGASPPYISTSRSGNLLKLFRFDAPVYLFPIHVLQNASTYFAAAEKWISTL